MAFAGTVGLAKELVRLYQLELAHYEKLERRSLSLDGKAQRLVPGGRPAFRIRCGHGGGVDDLGAVGDVRRVVADRRLDPMSPQAVGVARLRAVRAGHLRAERAGNDRQPAHAGTPDADEMQPARTPIRVAQCPPEAI